MMNAWLLLLIVIYIIEYDNISICFFHRRIFVDFVLNSVSDAHSKTTKPYRQFIVLTQLFHIYLSSLLLSFYEVGWNIGYYFMVRDTSHDSNHVNEFRGL